MKWAKTNRKDEWIAQGEKGHFLVWKDGRWWRALYMVEFGRVVKFRFSDRTVKSIKKRCEENYYWEA